MAGCAGQYKVANPIDLITASRVDASPNKCCHSSDFSDRYVKKFARLAPCELENYRFSAGLLFAPEVSVIKLFDFFFNFVVDGWFEGRVCEDWALKQFSAF